VKHSTNRRRSKFFHLQQKFVSCGSAGRLDFCRGQQRVDGHRLQL
jgi:hypothetical protein